MAERDSLPRPSGSVPVEGGALTPRAFRPDYKVDPVSGCWIWQKTLNAAGYGTGSFTSVGITTKYAHRAYYTVANGSVPDGFDVHHRCENTQCVNPAHLEACARQSHRRGHWVGRIDLTQKQIQEIRELGRDQTLRQQDIAERFGITRSRVSTLLNGQSWAEQGQRFRPEERICLMPGCVNEVHGRRDKRYCSIACGRESRKAMANV